MCVYGVVLINILVLQLGPPKQKFLAPPLAVPCLGRRGGLAMLWKNEMDLHIQTYTKNHIDALIMSNQNSPWRITGFYGKPEEQLRHEIWLLLKHLKSRSSTPWLCIGDYNEILASREKEGGNPKPL